MPDAIIIYQSKTGITKRFAEEIASYLNEKGIQSKYLSVNDCSNGEAEKADIVLLGCWTAGFMLLFQHPDRTWIRFAKQLPNMKPKKTALFTTYKIATGSMFKSMRKHLADKGNFSVELKSRNGKLTDQNKDILDKLSSLDS
jgi:flavodoxin